MDFRILGPLEVLSDGQVLNLGGQKQRALLAMLVLEANRVVSTDRLIDALWEDEPPETARKALQIYVSRLRKLLGNERLQTKPSGYLLRLEPDDLDLEHFRRLQAKGRFEQALALWRGPPLPEFAYQRFARGEIARLEELRLACIEERIERELEQGRHGELIGELEALVAEHPLRERLRAQLMLALYRDGRQAEALETYQQARRALTEELGLEPKKDLRRLQQAILSQDPMLDRAPVRGDVAPEPPRGVFVGRERELGELATALDNTRAGHGHVVLLGGEPGIGKSRLADELMRQARAMGARVLVGRCWEAGGAPAYWPWVQAMRAYLRETEPELVRAQMGVGAADLAQLLPELRELFADLPEPPALESESARFRLFEAVTAFLKSASQTHPLVMFLDDLHAADAPSLLMVQFVAREVHDARLLVLCAFRDVDPTMQDPLVSTLAEIVREPHTRQIALKGLREPEVARYIELAAGTSPAAALVNAIHGETEGNPLFVTELVRLLDAEGRLEEPRAPLRIPPGVRAVIRRRLARLSERCRAVLAQASVFGREFELAALARLGDLRRDELLTLLDEAMAERVVGDVPGSPGRLRFGHALIRDTLYDELTPVRRLGLHQRAAEVLEAVYAADLEPHLAELAYHFFAAAPAGEAGKAIDYAQRAGNRAASLLAYEEAVRLYEMALTLIDDDVARCELLLAVGDAHARAGETPASKDAFRKAAQLAKDHQLPEQLARAALGYGGRIMWDVSRDDEFLVPLLEGALAGIGDEDSTARARLLARLAGGPLRDTSFPPEKKASLSRQALEMARRIGDPATLAYALDGYIPANESPENTRELLELSTELLEIATELGDQERAVEAHEHCLNRCLELGEMSRAKAELEAMAKLATDLRQPTQEWLVGVCKARSALLEGKLAEAEDLIYEARSVGERALSWYAPVSFAIQLYVLRREQGRLEEVEHLIRRSADEDPTYSVWRCVLPHMAAELGYEAESREAFTALAADDFAAVPFEDVWLVCMGFLAEVAHLLGDAPSTQVHYEKLSPYSDRVAVVYPEFSIGSVSRYLGLLAWTLGLFEDAARHFEDAVALNQRIGARPWLAHTQEDYARMLLGQGGPEETERAVDLLAQALATYRELGMESYAARASALAAGVPSA